MTVIHSNDDLLEEPPCIVFSQAFSSLNKGEEIASWCIFHDKHKVMLGEEDFSKGNDVRMAEFHVIDDFSVDVSTHVLKFSTWRVN